MASLNIDFFNNVPPGEGTRYIVTKHSQVLIDALLRDMNDFSLKIHLKEKCLCQLYTLIVCIEGDGIKPYTERILKNIIYKMILEEGAQGE